VVSRIAGTAHSSTSNAETTLPVRPRNVANSAAVERAPSEQRNTVDENALDPSKFAGSDAAL
jgi:hypothetical protein